MVTLTNRLVQDLPIRILLTSGMIFFLAICVFALGAVSPVGEFIPILGIQEAWAGPYFNSREPGCDGSNSTVVWCDDFERAQWAVAYGEDQQPNPNNFGWNMGPFPPGSPCGSNGCAAGVPVMVASLPSIVCVGQGAAGTNCAGTTRGYGGIGSGAPYNGGDHNLGPNKNTYPALYVRFYLKDLIPILQGVEKMAVGNACCAGKGGIDFSDLFNFGGGSARNPQMTAIQQDTNFDQNLNATTMTPGNWWFVEFHIVLNTPGVADGTWELWLDNCGPNGLSCSGTPTKRALHTNVRYRNSGDSRNLGSLWFFPYSNPPPTNITLLDQIKVATTGPIGFASGSGGDVTPPSAPINLQVQ